MLVRRHDCRRFDRVRTEEDARFRWAALLFRTVGARLLVARSGRHKRARKGRPRCEAVDRKSDGGKEKPHRYL
jgi:hypothetical protein